MNTTHNTFLRSKKHGKGTKSKHMASGAMMRRDQDVKSHDRLGGMGTVGASMVRAKR